MDVLFGWAFYSYQTLPHVRLNIMGILTAAGCLVVLAVGLHGFLRWLSTQIYVSRKVRDQPFIPGRSAGPPRSWA